tara:strand:- start:4359 stop:4808 length:450 start_codon:yes stop_codon:yes gene_type:complete
MADKKVTQLTDLGNALASVDLFHVIDDPAGTPINKKITAEDVFNNMPTWLGVAQTSQALTADGAADVTSAVTEVNATSGTVAVSLEDGANGQIKTFLNTSTAGTNAVTITPASFRGGSTITLDAEGETVTVLFKNSNWNVIAGNSYVVA